MKAAVLEEIERLVVKEVPEPQLQEGTLLVKVRLCSICSTDLRIYHYGHPRIKLPHILGHEIAGEIAEVGRGVEGYRVGERVAVTPRTACGQCSYCRKGQPIHCLDSRSIGYQLPGGYAEYLLVPRSGVEQGVVSKLADLLGFEEGALAETVACCLRAQEACRVGPGDAVVVIGGGPVGIIHCRLARARGAARVILVENEVKRLERVSTRSIDEIVDSRQTDAEARVRALTGGLGADVVIVACSSGAAQEQALRMASRGGRVNFFAGLPPHLSRITVDSNIVHYQEVSVYGTHGSTPEGHREALAMLAERSVHVRDLITHHFPLDSIQEAFRFADTREGMHIAVMP